MNIYELLKIALDAGASDLHFGTNHFPYLRVDGDLIPLSDHPVLTTQDVERTVSELLLPEQMEAFWRDREYDFGFSYRPIGGRETRFRGNCFYEGGNMAMALRLIPMKIRSIEELGLPSLLHDVAKHRRGLFLVTGATGHGKTTTLAAILDEINRTRCDHIVTIEDPVEYIYASDKSIVHQREIGKDTKSFGEALRRVLRQDPDVILIGEMRDLETVGAAITAAETGHLVLATLHTQDAAQSVDRIIDVFPPHQQQQIRLQFASVLLGICSQQLIPSPSGGVIVATELLFATPAVRNCIKEGKTSQLKTVIQTSSDSGMQTMEQCLAKKVNDGVLPLDVALSYAYDPKDLQRILFQS